ncbi:MAG TPA: hypothetical protein VIT67_12435 [Povalibacter sp.]
MQDGTFEAATEVELSAQDLLALEPPRAPAEPRVQPAAVGAPAVDVVKPAKPAPASRNRWSPQYTAWAVALAIAVGVGFGAVQLNSAPPRHARNTIVSSIPQKPDPIIEDEEPTLARNPFDPSEVFELPPGMSEEEARIAVADLLMKRAADRQASIATRHASNR